MKGLQAVKVLMKSVSFYGFLVYRQHIVTRNLNFTVLGGWSNTNSTIRSQKYITDVTNKGGEVLHPLYLTEILITLTKDGMLSVVLPNYQSPFLAYQDVNKNLYSKYISFAGWENSPARWFYDCPLKISRTTCE